MLGALHLSHLFAFNKIGVHLLCPACCSLGNLTSLLSQLEMSLSCTFLDGEACLFPSCRCMGGGKGTLLNFAPVP